MNPFIWLIVTIIDLYFWIILISVIASWLVHFGIINYSNPTVRAILRALAALTEPVLAPIRRLLPNMGGLDISPVIALIGLQFLQYLVLYYAAPMIG